MKNVLMVISGPSGVGKGTIVKELLKRRTDVALSVSCTTREPRKGEVDGREYFFLSKEEFLNLEAEYNAFKKYFESCWKETKKQIRRKELWKK